MMSGKSLTAKWQPLTPEFPEADTITPFGLWILRNLRKMRRNLLPFVTLRTFLRVKYERDCLFTGLHRQAIQINKLEAKLRAKDKAKG
jgi:hypothetical protein